MSHKANRVSHDSLEGMTTFTFVHVPVLGQEFITGLITRPNGLYLDTTVGGGGHSRLILETCPNSQVIAIDQDEQAIAAAQAKLSPYQARVTFWQGNFADYHPGDVRFDGVIADLGVSSAQLDIPERGFSFRHEAPLDMRMDRRQDLTAADIINHWEEAKLADIFYHYGEERRSRRIARQIVAQRPFQTTTELAAAIARCTPPKQRYGRIHPATRTFQALRIAVNQELSVLETLLERAPTWLTPGGRIGVISFHSLEDRLVKYAFRANPDLKVLTKKPITAQPDEIKANPRSRSAKLRFAERIGGED
ncbi:MAG: 16S rRNA (cytosine(1402)-N(4))-methyltransferase RsmH [Leptolyngbyaceae cyanobacterium MO_188.B28]|nr:16S rRNA (cytosine(1402)-N(4))-methyltransferase RsmH [Leptolyngbyaceae cyanobacterium MO_188.B28]